MSVVAWVVDTLSPGTAAQVAARGTFDAPLEATIALVVFAASSLFAAGTAAIVYRWYVRDEVPEGVTVLVGVATVAVYLNTVSLGALVWDGDLALYRPDAVVFNVVALVVAAAVTPVGRRVGDSLARNTVALTGAVDLEGDVSRIVQTVGRMTAVTLPPAEEIEDVESYEPVPDETRSKLGSRTLLFPRDLTVDDLRSRLIERLREDYGVGYVDVDLDEAGRVEYIAVGSRAAGLGPTLAPGSVAVAIAADPAREATAGDLVQVWSNGDDPTELATAELRATAGDVVTLAIDEGEADALAADGQFRLVTLPAEKGADREFVSLVRNADETMAAVTVAPGSTVVGTPVGEAESVVVAVRPADGPIQALPPGGYTFAVGDRVYLIGRAGSVRRFERRAAGDGEPDQHGTTTDGRAP